MNLIFAASVQPHLSVNRRDMRPEWREELRWLTRYNQLFLWDDSVVELKTWLKTSALTLDETALVGNSEVHLRVAQAASLPCYTVGQSIPGAEQGFADWAGLVDTVWKINTVERRLFPIVTVGGLLRDGGGHCLLVRSRKWSGLWGIPGGKVEYGETMEAAFTREIREETGLIALHSRLVMAQDCIEHPQFFRPRHFVLMNYLADVEGLRPVVRLNHEGVEYLWATLSEAMTMALNDPTRRLVDKIMQPGAPLWMS